MARRALPLFSNLWKRHETLYVHVFSIALAQLAIKACPLDDEDKISEQLCPFLSAVCFNESKKRNCEIGTPDWEKPIQPVVNNELKDGKRKRPDFTCKCYNPFASCTEEHEIALHVECKLLGDPTSKNWILNENYTTRGIKRFDAKSHEYGKRAPSGLIIGYIISMEPEQIVCEVNNFQQKQFPNNTTLSFQFNNPPVFKEKQNLKRKNVNPEIFQLIHLWVDLRV
ncbi:MAG: hypothetical protein ABIN18_17905 [Pseudomonadota bacterium]